MSQAAAYCCFGVLCVCDVCVGRSRQSSWSSGGATHLGTIIVITPIKPLDFPRLLAGLSVILRGTLPSPAPVLVSSVPYLVSTN